MSKLNQIDWSSYGYDFVRDEGWIPIRICLIRNKHIPAESDNTIKSERSLENEGGQQEVITDITNTISQRANKQIPQKSKEVLIRFFAQSRYATEKDIEELEKDSGLEKSQIQNWLKRKRVEQSKRGDKRKWRK